MKKTDLVKDLKDLLKEYLPESVNGTDVMDLADKVAMLTETYMVPRPVLKLLDTPDGDIPVIVNEWE